MTRHGLIIMTLLCAFGAYHMPWVTHAAAAFTNNAFDLAEFMSLAPAVQAESPALLTSLLLRLPIVLVAALLSLTASQLRSEKAKWLTHGGALLMVLRLNPPTVYYPFGGGSLNDQQLGDMMLGGLAFILVLIVLSHWLKSWLYAPITTVLAIVTAGVALQGWSRSLDVIEGLQLDVQTGGGMILFVGLLLTVAIQAVWPYVVMTLHLRNNPKGQNGMRPAPRVVARQKS
jgi:hypothetical protein